MHRKSEGNVIFSQIEDATDCKIDHNDVPQLNKLKYNTVLYHIFLLNF